MNKNRGLVIAVVLLLIYGTGMFVFAGSSDEDFSEPGQNIQYKEDSKQNKGENTTNQTNENLGNLPTDSDEEENILPEETVNDGTVTGIVNNTQTNTQKNPSQGNTNNQTTNKEPNTGGNSNENNTNNGNNNNNNNTENGGNNNPGNGNNNPNENETENKPGTGEDEKNPIPSFNFVDGDSFSNNKIIINEPNYSYMVVSYWPNKVETITSNEYTVNLNTLYTFKLYDANGNIIKEAEMVYDSIKPKIVGKGITLNGVEKTTISTEEVYKSVTLTFTDNDLNFIKRINAIGQEEIIKEFGKYDVNRRNYTKTFTTSGTYHIVAIDRAGNETSIDFSIA